MNAFSDGKPSLWGGFDFVNGQKSLDINGTERNLPTWALGEQKKTEPELTAAKTLRGAGASHFFIHLLNPDAWKYVFSEATNENKLVIKLAHTTRGKKRGVIFQVMRIFLHANEGLGRRFRKTSFRSSLLWSQIGGRVTLSQGDNFHWCSASPDLFINSSVHLLSPAG